MLLNNHIITIPQFQSFTSIKNENTIVVIDENVYNIYQKKIKKYSTIVIKAGEKHKNQTTVNSILKQLISLKANRATTLVGIGGGVVTDITGYVASVYMRGINFGFVPTTLLAMVDASIGGKNGVNLGVYKNMIGTFNQPEFIIQDVSFLKTLPNKEWQNGFAEIIKHASICNNKMFNELQNQTLKKWQLNTKRLEALIEHNINIKCNIVANDVYEKGDRKLLNFGHTLGHALENEYKLSHGQAISIGMVFACKLSEQILGFNKTKLIKDLLLKYGLPINYEFNKIKVFKILTNDKKREVDKINFILLEDIGVSKIVAIKLEDIKNALQVF